MPRTRGKRAAEKKKAFIWLPREKDLVYTVYIDSVDETNNYFSASFTRAIFPEIGSFKIELINADGSYTNKYSSGTIVQFYLDLEGSGPTKRFEGKIDTIKPAFSGDKGYFLVLEGGHVSSNDVLNTHVTESYTGDKSCDEIFIELVGEYLSGYTTTNVNASTTKPTINWDRKPLVDCFNDLCNLAEFDGYCDDSKDFHFFARKSIHNSNEAIVWNDTLLETSGLGLQSLDTRNYIQVYGDDGTGLPIIHTSEDSNSQGTYDKKEQMVVDSAISSMAQAIELASATLALKKTPEVEGRALSLMLPSLAPGQTIYISDPTMGILDKYKIAKYTQKLPLQQTDCVIFRKKTLPSLFKERIAKELALETVTNPFKMTKSINLKFNDSSELASNDSNVEISDGKIRLSSGTEGTATSNAYGLSSDITQIHLLVVGEQFATTLFNVSTDGGSSYETVPVNELVTIGNPGDSIVVQIAIKSASTEIDSIALLLK